MDFKGKSSGLLVELAGGVEAELLFALAASCHKGPVSLLLDHASIHQVTYKLSSVLTNLELLLHLGEPEFQFVDLGILGTLDVVSVDFLVPCCLHLCFGPFSLAVGGQKISSYAFRF